MEDKLLCVKKELKKIAETKSLTCVEKYELVKKIKETLLDEMELKILINEYKKDYVYWNQTSETPGVIYAWFSGTGLLTAVAAIYYNKISLSRNQYVGIVILIGVVCVFFILGIHMKEERKSNSLSTIKYIIDILEE